MKILVFGQTGQVARELAAYDSVTCLGRDRADLSDPAACEAVITHTDADVVINAAAYTAVDRAEEERETTMIINAMAPTVMAAAAAARGLPFVQISTDYVFDGSGTEPWAVDSPCTPLGVYGASKLGGERGVAAADGTHAILRTSWIFSAHGNNFVKTMLRLGAERDSLSIVADQIGGPTPARDIAQVAITIAKALLVSPEQSGIYHFSGAPDISWAGFARRIFTQAGLGVEVIDITTEQYPTPAARPLNSRLDCRTTHTVFGIQRANWQAGLEKVLADLNKA